MKRSALVIVNVIAFFVVVELLMSFVLLRKSKDLGRFGEYPKRAEALCSSGGTSVMIIGNSTTQAGVDGRQLEKLLRDAGVRDPKVGVFTVDASGITTWYYLAKNDLVCPGRTPSLVVLNYNYTNLEGDINLQVGRLAQYFTRPSDWRGVLAELSSGGDRCEFMLSLFWKTLAFRSRLRDRVLGMVIPNRIKLEEQVYRSAVDHEGRASSAPPADYSRLERFLRLIKRSGTSLMVVAYPVRPIDGKPGFHVDPNARRLIESYGFTFKDLTLVHSLRKDMYLDNLHLNDKGKRIYTRVLSRELLQEIRHPAQRRLYVSSH